MSTTQILRMATEAPWSWRGEASRRSSQTAWLLPVAVALLGAGWGSSQFTPMLLVYRHALGVGTGTLEAMFGAYALGLIPGLLLAGPPSDARGRRTVVVPGIALSLVASIALVAGAHSVALLFVGRLLAGVSSGAVFGAGTAWLREASLPPIGTASDATAARRAAVAMTAGFAMGPLVAGLLAQWGPATRVVAYLPHVVLMAIVLASLRDVPETVGGPARPLRLSVPAVRHRRFLGVVAPIAPWVFTAPAIAFALLPSVVGAGHATDAVAVAAAIASVTALAGVLIQPVGRRLEARAQGNRAGVAGLLLLAAGLALGAGTAMAYQIWLLIPCAIVLGAAYGLCLIGGLLEIQRLAEAGAVAGLTAAYYALSYLGFGVPYVLALAAHVATYPVLLAITAALALATAALVTRTAAREA
jgi:predicted MFS family arabinose efflux permease